MNIGDYVIKVAGYGPKGGVRIGRDLGFTGIVVAFDEDKPSTKRCIVLNDLGEIDGWLADFCEVVYPVDKIQENV